MFDYPKQAELNRILPKSKIYAHARPGRALRDCFTSQIGEIVWKYKLSPETVNLPARQGIHEIQVFVIALKTAALAPEVLRTIDRSIPSPLFFELTFQNQVRFRRCNFVRSRSARSTARANFSAKSRRSKSGMKSSRATRN
jgi:hypothetical protein